MLNFDSPIVCFEGEKGIDDLLPILWRVFVEFLGAFVGKTFFATQFFIFREILFESLLCYFISNEKD